MYVMVSFSLGGHTGRQEYIIAMRAFVRGRPFDIRFLSAQVRTPHVTSPTFATHVNDRTTAKLSAGGS
jgi:hypothetical protein